MTRTDPRIDFIEQLSVTAVARARDLARPRPHAPNARATGGRSGAGPNTAQPAGDDGAASRTEASRIPRVSFSVESPNFLSSAARYGITIALVLAGFVALALFLGAATQTIGADRTAVLVSAALVCLTCFTLAYFSVMGIGRVAYSVRAEGTPTEDRGAALPASPGDDTADRESVVGGQPQ